MQLVRGLYLGTAKDHSQFTITLLFIWALPVAICNNGGTKLPFDLEYNFQLINKVTIRAQGDNNRSKSKLLC